MDNVVSKRKGPKNIKRYEFQAVIDSKDLLHFLNTEGVKKWMALTELSN